MTNLLIKVSQTRYGMREQQPLSEMPIWARLEFAKIIPKAYSINQITRPLHTTQGAIITGFERCGDIIWIYYEIRWPGDSRIHKRIQPVAKSWSIDLGYMLTPLSDPTTFSEPKDGRSYHLCDMPGPNHIHNVPFPYANCYDRGSWTWESRYDPR